MNRRSIFTNAAVALAIGGFMVAPMSAEAQGRGNKNGHDKGSWNSAPPKKNGRHDNRDWNKGGNSNWDRRGDNNDWNRRNDDWRNNDWQRREDERRREEARRREDERRREEERRREDARRRQEWERRNNSDWNRRNDDWRNNGGWNDSDRRQETKNEWRNIALASGAVAILGLLNNDSTLTFTGAAGALYSAYRYEQDRKSQNRVDRLRATYFSQDHFYRDGQRYSRKTVNRNGQTYYQFCRD